jgi:Uma2 family endonuclease
MDIETSTAPVPEAAEVVPRLRDGERLSRAEFERRYAAHSEPRFAELIEGVVYVASPVSTEHAEPHSSLNTCLGFYRACTPGVFEGANATVRLSEQDEPQSDIYLRIGQEYGGQSRVDEDRFLVGAPELVAEVSVSRAEVDRGPKLRAYEAAGVREYILWRVLDQLLEWFVLREGRFELLAPGEDGILRSEIFPGLWLDAAALLRDDTATLFRVVQAGLASPEHGEFVQRLAQRARRGQGE